MLNLKKLGICAILWNLTFIFQLWIFDIISLDRYQWGMLIIRSLIWGNILLESQVLLSFYLILGNLWFNISLIKSFCFILVRLLILQNLRYINLCLSLRLITIILPLWLARQLLKKFNALQDFICIGFFALIYIFSIVWCLIKYLVYHHFLIKLIIFILNLIHLLCLV